MKMPDNHRKVMFTIIMYNFVQKRYCDEELQALNSAKTTSHTVSVKGKSRNQQRDWHSVNERYQIIYFRDPGVDHLRKIQDTNFRRRYRCISDGGTVLDHYTVCLKVKKHTQLWD
ncbi:hypothetical protein SARC_08331 [Sphaeroforma arctica JP610]|uniref:Uncharacterized protein n=1 Tax=Sphaeroforma arctica JP610 TaxID=667725 RepID=A0A0L0FRF4_9EUKA|nr:hypothetical protein SARC_08331 [Sphaeroforma arctica JP610]KNC79269.1 hypothetical protein SARC_08331 [Sphaeroforma arctica JP610]|eukprot:XP_014153171.1 hypothetical protein SARC_08331 [Sphaeroforma arctica JP610]